MKKLSILKRIFVNLVFLFSFLFFACHFYEHVNELKHSVKALVTEINISPNYYEASAPGICAEGGFEKELYQTEFYHLALAAKYNRLWKEYRAELNENYESRSDLNAAITNYDCHYEIIKVGQTINVTLSEGGKTLRPSSFDFKFPTVILLMFSFMFVGIFALLYEESGVLFNNDIFISPIKSLPPKKELPFFAYIRNAKLNDIDLKLGYGGGRILAICLLIISSIVWLPVILASVTIQFLFFEGPWENFMSSPFDIMSIIGQGCLFLFLGCLPILTYVIAFKPLRVSKKYGVVWKGYFRPSKINVIAKIEDIKEIELFSKNSYFRSCITADFILKDGSKIHFASFRGAKGIDAFKEYVESLSIPVITPAISLGEKYLSEYKDKVWRGVSKKIGHFDKIKIAGDYLVLDYSFFTKLIYYIFPFLFLVYCYYALSSRISTVFCVVVCIYAVLLGVEWISLSPKKFNLSKSVYGYRAILNLFGYIEISFDQIDFLYLLCVHGHKGRPSLIQLNLFCKEREPINLLTTLSYKKAFRLANELAKGINKPLFVDPYLEKK